MTRGFLDDIIAEEDDAAAYFSQHDDVDEEESADMPAWSGYLVAAWNHLRDDRYWSQTGECGGIFYSAISAYAADHGIVGEFFSQFLTFLRAIDDAFVAYSAEQAKEAIERAKAGQS